MRQSRLAPTLRVLMMPLITFFMMPLLLQVPLISWRITAASLLAAMIPVLSPALTQAALLQRMDPILCRRQAISTPVSLILLSPAMVLHLLLGLLTTVMMTPIKLSGKPSRLGGLMVPLTLSRTLTALTMVFLLPHQQQSKISPSNSPLIVKAVLLLRLVTLIILVTERPPLLH